jgi:hypothetical protein
MPKWVRVIGLPIEETWPVYRNMDNGFILRTVIAPSDPDKVVLRFEDASGTVLTWLYGTYDSIDRATEVVRLLFGAVSAPSA